MLCRIIDVITSANIHIICHIFLQNLQKFVFLLYFCIIIIHINNYGTYLEMVRQER